MKRSYFLLGGFLVLLAGIACKTQHFYQREEYSFYVKDFLLPDTALLRTDGVYVLVKIRTSEKDKMVMQKMLTARVQFYYSYFRLAKDSIVLVSTTHTGKGKIKNKYYTNYYEAFYHFVPVQEAFITPDW